MARGNDAKSQVEKKIVKALGDDYIGTFDKKIYTWAMDDGERIQVAISMTCPKTFIGNEPKNDSLDFDAMENPGQVSSFKPAEITEEETANVNKLLAELGF